MSTDLEKYTRVENQSLPDGYLRKKVRNLYNNQV